MTNLMTSDTTLASVSLTCGVATLSGTAGVIQRTSGLRPTRSPAGVRRLRNAPTGLNATLAKWSRRECRRSTGVWLNSRRTATSAPSTIAHQESEVTL